MNTSDSFQLGKFKFRSVSSEVDVMFQDEIKEHIDEDEAHTKEELDKAYQRGLEEARLELQPVIDQQQQELLDVEQKHQTQFSELVVSIETYAEKLEKQLFDEVCKMSFTLAKTILQKEISQIDDVEKLIRQSLSEIHSEKKVTVRLSNDDFNLLQDKFSSPRLECMNDPALNNGEAIVEYEQGHLDLTLNSRISELGDAFENLRNTGEDDA
jgi:flagellar biosynthesis/type III secretory pathway protein FliH